MPDGIALIARLPRVTEPEASESRSYIAEPVNDAEDAPLLAGKSSADKSVGGGSASHESEDRAAAAAVAAGAPASGDFQGQMMK